jgi:hypothetical protein
VLSAPGTEHVYVSGDNASLDVVRAISERVGDIAIAVLFAGAVQLARKFDGAYLTLSSGSSELDSPHRLAAPPLVACLHQCIRRALIDSRS